VITPSYRDRFEAEHGPLREVLLVSPAAARVLDAAREMAGALRLVAALGEPLSGPGAALVAADDLPERAATPPADPDPGDDTVLRVEHEEVVRELADLRESLAGSVWMAPGLKRGEPCIGGTRILASTIAGLAADGLSGEEIRASYPTVTDAGVAAAVAWRERLVAVRRDIAVLVLMAASRDTNCLDDSELLVDMAAEARSGARTVPTTGEETDHA
jgi:uncharacterized protein (DUF433 family)